MSEPIRFFAQVSKVQTMPDMGLRLTLDFSETNIMQAAMLMECKRMQVLLDVECTPQNRTVGDDSHDSKQGRPEQKSLRGQ